MMRLGISLQEGYLIILATLIVLQGASGKGKSKRTSCGCGR